MTQKKIRINWKQQGVEKTFLEACIHKITLQGLAGSSLKPSSWKNVAEKLKTEHSFITDQKQMKNRYDYLKGKFAAWSKLKNKTGNFYNPLRNTFNLSEEEWQSEMKSNTYVEALRGAALCYPKVCVQLFEGSTSNGFDSWGPSSTLPHPSEEVADHNINDIDDFERTQMGPTTQGVSEESSLRSNNKREKRKVKETVDKKLIEVGDQISKVAKMLLENHNLSNNMGACMEKLKTIGWEKSDPKYKMVLLLFGESVDIRKVWLELGPDTCEDWVEIAGAKYGLF